MFRSQNLHTTYNHHRYPITVCIKSVDQSGKIEVTFENNTEDDLSILKWYTPLEGTMMTPFLTVRDETGEKLKYEGLMAKYVSNPTREDFVVIHSRGSVSSIIDLNEAYNIEKGKYIIEYTGSIEYVAGSIELKKLEDLNEQEMAGACRGITIEVKYAKMLKKKDGDKTGFKNGTEAQRKITQQLLEELKDPNQGYQKVIQAVNIESDLYEKWFGEYAEKRVEKVKQVYQACHDGLKKKNNIIYVFDANIPRAFAYTQPMDDDVFEIGFTSDYDKAPEKESDNSKLQTLVHELSHVYGNTDDVKKGYGVTKCLDLAKKRPDDAVKNADSYGYFYCDVAVLQGRIPLPDPLPACLEAKTLN